MDGDLAKYQSFLSGKINGIIGSYISVKNARNRANVITLTQKGMENIEKTEELEKV